MDRADWRIQLDHIGIACEELEEASVFWNLIGLNRREGDELVESQGVITRFFSTSSDEAGVVSTPAKVELLKPTGPDTAIGKFLQKRGAGIQQICFRVSDLNSLLDHLADNGIQLINRTPVDGSLGKKIAFVHPNSTGGVLVELMQMAD